MHICKMLTFITIITGTSTIRDNLKITHFSCYKYMHSVPVHVCVCAYVCVHAHTCVCVCADGRWCGSSHSSWLMRSSSIMWLWVQIPPSAHFLACYTLHLWIRSWGWLVGLSQLCSKLCTLCFWECSKLYPIMPQNLLIMPELCQGFSSNFKD